jgi:hypothetical protein
MVAKGVWMSKKVRVLIVTALVTVAALVPSVASAHWW